MSETVWIEEVPDGDGFRWAVCDHDGPFISYEEQFDAESYIADLNTPEPD